MKHRLQKIYWTGILLTLLMAFIAIAVATRLKIKDTRSYLNAMLQAASRWTLDSNEDLQTLADSIAAVSPSMRVTFLLDTGLILADSTRDADTGVSHHDDPEIVTARDGKIGSDLRISTAGAAVVLHMAQRVAPQLLLRISYPVLEIAGLLLFYGSLLICLFLALYLLERRMIARYAADQQRQLEDVRRLLDGEIRQVEAAFPEYQPSLDAISYRIRRLEEDREEIIRTMNLRADFVANASHELRSPLTSIQGFAEMLKEGLAADEDEKALCVDMIYSESRRMLDVIEDILRLSKAEKKNNQEAEPIHAGPVAEEICTALEPQAAEKKITLSCTGDILIRAQERDIWEILYNLADNAIRYGREGGHVRIRLQPGRIEVEDDGIGIAPEHTGRIFEQFYRVDETKDGTAGTGLGLSIVRAITQSCGGSIDVRSVCGEGSVFTLLFPAVEDAGMEKAGSEEADAEEEAGVEEEAGLTRFPPRRSTRDCGEN